MKRLAFMVLLSSVCSCEAIFAGMGGFSKSVQQQTAQQEQAPFCQYNADCNSGWHCSRQPGASRGVCAR